MKGREDERKRRASILPFILSSFPPARKEAAMNYDAIILGAGQAGGPLAYGLADKGWSVALVEREHLGGTCINTGCTPTKTMVASAQVAHYARNARKWGVHTEGVQL